MAKAKELTPEEYSEDRKKAQAEIDANKVKDTTKKEEIAKTTETKETKLTQKEQVKQLLELNTPIEKIAETLGLSKKRCQDLRWHINKKAK